MAFIEIGAGDPEYGNLASFLLALAEENGYHVRTVRTVAGGFDVPDALAAQLEPYSVPDVPAVTPSVEEKTPPAWWGEPEPTVDVEFGADGKVYLKDEAVSHDEKPADPGNEPDRETVRAWAKENGHEVADKGQLKKAIYEAFAAAQAE